MIQANELRIGNWLQRPEPLTSKALDGPVVYRQVDSEMIRYCDFYKSDWSYNHIPLTPEILEKAGFEKTQEGYRFIGDARLAVWRKNEWLITRRGFDLLPGMALIKYVHQLQNLYFALTGKELIVNL